MAKTSGLLKFFGIDTDPIIGLDIGSSAVKVMQLGKSGDKIKIEHFALEPLDPGVIQDKNIIEKDKLLAAIRTAIRKSGAKTSKVCIAIPNAMAITKVIKMSSDLSDKEIGNEIELESSKYIPYPLSEVNYDYTVIGKVENNENLVNVLLAVSKEDNVRNVCALLIEAGLEPAIVDIEGYAIARAFDLVAKKLPAQGKNKVIAVFDIGATNTSLNILDKGNVIYVREQNFGSQQLIEEIQNIYGLTYDEAILRLKYENLPKDFYTEVLDPFKQSVVQQISRFCQFFFSAGDYNAIDYIFLTGGCSGIFGLDTMVQNKLQIKTFVANPFDDMFLAANIEKAVFKDASLRLMKCCGLALRNVMDKKA